MTGSNEWHCLHVEASITAGLRPTAPYGQSFVEWSAAETLIPEEFARVQTTAAALANHWMNTVIEQGLQDFMWLTYRIVSSDVLGETRLRCTSRNRRHRL